MTRSLGHLLVELSTIRKSRIVTSMKHAYTPMIEIDKSDTIVAGVSPAKVKESQPARLPLHLITESLLQAACRAHPRFRSPHRDQAVVSSPACRAVVPRLRDEGGWSVVSSSCG